MNSIRILQVKKIQTCQIDLNINQNYSNNYDTVLFLTILFFNASVISLIEIYLSTKVTTNDSLYFGGTIVKGHICFRIISFSILFSMKYFSEFSSAILGWAGPCNFSFGRSGIEWILVDQSVF